MKPSQALGSVNHFAYGGLILPGITSQESRSKTDLVGVRADCRDRIVTGRFRRCTVGVLRHSVVSNSLPPCGP